MVDIDIKPAEVVYNFDFKSVYEKVNDKVNSKLESLNYYHNKVKNANLVLWNTVPIPVDKFNTLSYGIILTYSIVTDGNLIKIETFGVSSTKSLLKRSKDIMSRIYRDRDNHNIEYDACKYSNSFIIKDLDIIMTARNKVSRTHLYNMLSITSINMLLESYDNIIEYIVDSEYSIHRLYKKLDKHIIKYKDIVDTLPYDLQVVTYNTYTSEYKEYLTIMGDIYIKLMDIYIDLYKEILKTNKE